MREIVRMRRRTGALCGAQLGGTRTRVAAHLIVIRDDRLIEIQLRTQRQHLWATHVERLEMTRREALRGGSGHLATVEALRGLADAFAEADAGRAPALLAHLQVWLAQLTDKG